MTFPKVPGEKWDAIRQFYRESAEYIHSRAVGFGIDVYAIDWPSFFTPIEADIWFSIRGIGIPLYPQYPVGGVFVDFGDPVKRVAVECDGWEYHKHGKDAGRDARLEQAGWHVFRIRGYECVRPGIDYEDLRMDLLDQRITEGEFDASIRDWAMNTGDGVIAAIADHFYGVKHSDRSRKFLVESLAAHCATDHGRCFNGPR